MARKKRVSIKSVEKLQNLHQKMLKKGIFAKDAMKFDAKEWKRAFGGKKQLSKTNLAAAKRNLKQIKLHEKRVLDFKFKKQGISDKVYQKFIENRTKELFEKETRKRHKPKKTKEKPKEPEEPTDIKINGYVHKQDKSVTLKTMRDLEDFLDSIDKSNSRYNKKHDILISDEEKKRLRTKLNVYQNMDYGGRIRV